MRIRKDMKKAASFALAMAVTCAEFSLCLPVKSQAFETETDRVEEILSGMTIEEKVGQMIMADFRNWNENPEDEDSEAVPMTELRKEVKEAVAKDRFGGIILFAENCPENEQTLSLVQSLQEANLDTDSKTAVPLLIAIDEEGGIVARLGQGTRWIGNMALTATGDPENAREAALNIGQELSALSINTDFAPVIDVNNNPANPVIGCRSFSDDPDIVAAYVLSYLQGLKESGTISSLKHFPGHGDVATDSHTGFPILDKSYEELKACELIPFQAAIDAGAEMVMTAHIQYPQIEERTYTSVSTGEEVFLPATLSSVILQDILRKDMGFEGVIVSDALNMAAIADNFALEDTAKLAIEAGINMFLMPVPVTDQESLDKLEGFIAYLCEQVEAGEIDEALINDSVRRILTLKEKHGLLPAETDEITEDAVSADAVSEEPAEEAADTLSQVGSPESHKAEWEMMQKSVTLLKNEGGLLPYHAKADEKILFLYSGTSRAASAEFAKNRLVEEELVPEDTVFETMVYSDETKDDCLKAAKEADLVITVSTAFNLDSLDPETESGAFSAWLDSVIDAVHEGGKPFILISGYLPYDAARYQEADAIVLSYGSSAMKELPKEKEGYSVNIPAAICGVFGEYEFTGSLPINIPKLDDQYGFSEEILYPRMVAVPGQGKGYQINVSFPDWKGYTDDTLAMNSMISFLGYHGQGSLEITVSEEVTGFELYINGIAVDTAEFAGGGQYTLDISEYTRNGENTLQVSGITPFDLKEAVKVSVPYPTVLPGEPEEEGISEQTLAMISDLIENDVANGFTSASLAVIRNGRLVYENAWGRTNSYHPDGTPDEESPLVTTDTLYDLASVTKMFSVNYALQKLVTDGEVKLDDTIASYLGESFYTEDPILTDTGDDPGIDPETMKEWKAALTIRDLLRHQGGFPADPKYPSPLLYKEDTDVYPENPLFAGNGADEETKIATIEMIGKTPLNYEPGTKTVYSDLDYMILGLVVEKVTGKDLNSYLKETFWEPMGLTHITYNPLQQGFEASDCAATELNGNTRDGYLDFSGYRTYTLQGEVHDEKAFYSMEGISGHAGLFSNATDLAKLASVMLSGGYGEYRFFSRNVMNQFMAPKREDAGNWGLGWWRQGDSQRVWYFGTQAGSNTIGHQGWTGTIVMIDPDRQLVIAYLTNKINSRITDFAANPNKFNGGWYTAATLGFVPQLLSIGMDASLEETEISDQLLTLCADMAVESLKLVPEGISFTSDHPSVKNVESKLSLFKDMAEKSEDTEKVKALRKRIREAYEKVSTAHEEPIPAEEVEE
ncbi:MAG: penicillin binding protein PBP4B [Lachnospiraceae bacterium]|nr:penicillin binding protein PBP4B [Lachnospiraceae bacterium]